MKVFADTNFFTHLWLDLRHTPEAQSLFEELLDAEAVLPVTRLTRMEFTNALQRLVFESRTGTQDLRINLETAMATQAILEDELTAAVWAQWTPIHEAPLEAVFENLAYRHTAKHGFRTYDILHVASALILDCDTFWTFDERAKRLAALEGLRTNG